MLHEQYNTSASRRLHAPSCLRATLLCEAQCSISTKTALRPLHFLVQCWVQCWVAKKPPLFLFCCMPLLRLRSKRFAEGLKHPWGILSCSCLVSYVPYTQGALTQNINQGIFAWYGQALCSKVLFVGLPWMSERSRYCLRVYGQGVRFMISLACERRRIGSWVGDRLRAVSRGASCSRPPASWRSKSSASS